MTEVKKKLIDSEPGLEHQGDVLEFPTKAVPQPEQDPDTLADSVAEAIDPDALRVPPIGKYIKEKKSLNVNGEKDNTLDKITSTPSADIPRGRQIADLLQAMKADMTDHERGEDAGARNMKKAA